MHRAAEEVEEERHRSVGRVEGGREEYKPLKRCILAVLSGASFLSFSRFPCSTVVPLDGLELTLGSVREEEDVSESSYIRIDLSFFDVEFIKEHLHQVALLFLFLSKGSFPTPTPLESDD